MENPPIPIAVVDQIVRQQELIASLQTENEQLRKVVDGVFALIDDKVLVRNIDDDHDTSKFVAQGMRIMEVIIDHGSLPHVIARNSPKAE